MAQALYRKWRSRTFEEVVGQEHVIQTLRNALRDGRVAHAYLLAGPRGTGKTSTARILAKALNCEDEETRPCNRCSRCEAIDRGQMLDLIEIDAASNNSVDDIRELRDKVGFRPSESKFKVYIIDEVHMLSVSAFNALLKTLEEPPPFARFVLATTEPHRIPATVLSRCQRFDFRRIPVSEIVDHLKAIASKEEFDVEDAAVNAIARSAQGCMRDAVSLLDQMTSFAAGKEVADRPRITMDQVQQVLGGVDSATVTAFVDRLAERDSAAGLKLIHGLLLQGGSLQEFAGQVVEHLRGVMLVQLVGDGALLEDRAQEVVRTMREQASQLSKEDTLSAIKRFSEAMAELKGGHQPQLPLELAFLDAVQGVRPLAAASDAAAVGTPAQPSTAPPPRPKPPVQQPRQAGAAAEDARPTAPADTDSVQLLRDRWQEFHKMVRERCGPSEQASLRSISDLTVSGDTVVMAFGANAFAKDVISKAKTKDVIASILAELLGRNVSLLCQSGKKAVVPISSSRPAQRENEEGPDALIAYAVSELGAEVNSEPLRGMPPPQ